MALAISGMLKMMRLTTEMEKLLGRRKIRKVKRRRERLGAHLRIERYLVEALGCSYFPPTLIYLYTFPSLLFMVSSTSITAQYFLFYNC